MMYPPTKNHLPHLSQQSTYSHAYTIYRIELDGQYSRGVLATIIP
jgi:hypothetical protein